MASCKVFCFALALAPIVALMSAPPLGADTVIKVSTTDDEVAVNGNCTLREAIIAANADTPVDRCPAGSGSDAIILPAGIYLLSHTGPNDDAAKSGDLDIAGATIIRGAGAGTTVIDGGTYGGGEWMLSDRVLHVLSGGALSLFGVTVQGGVCSSGAGIFNAGTLLLDSSVIQNNLQTVGSTLCEEAATRGGAGIYSQGTLTVRRSLITGNDIDWLQEGADPGGGLLNTGAAHIEDSQITRNRAAAGGGIENHGDLHVTNTEIGLNTARFWGGGLRNRSTGAAYLTQTTVRGNGDGGILNGGQIPSQPGGTLIVRNSTVSGNFSARYPGSIINWGGVVEITSSTIANNLTNYHLPGAGLGGSAPIVLRDTIVANPGYGDCADAVVSLGHNLDSDGSCGLTRPGDLPNTDPLLGPLADNGGPTLTHGLLPGSPALDRIPAANCAVSTDQRGVIRPEVNWGACDIGAYEFSPLGDIFLLSQDVRDLTYRPLTPLQAQVLQGPLKAAYRAASAGDAESGCRALDGFAMTVSDYVGLGFLSPAEAFPLIEAAHRIRGMLCP
jgi:CSLREA domain-containing protein